MAKKPKRHYKRANHKAPWTQEETASLVNTINEGVSKGKSIMNMCTKIGRVLKRSDISVYSKYRSEIISSESKPIIFKHIGTPKEIGKQFIDQPLIVLPSMVKRSLPSGVVLIGKDRAKEILVERDIIKQLMEIPVGEGLFVPNNLWKQGIEHFVSRSNDKIKWERVLTPTGYELVRIM